MQASHKQILKAAKLLILDVDGVLTDGKITLTPNGEELLSFHVHDGFGIKRLQETNMHIAVISGRNTKAVAHRLAYLGIKHVYLGQREKITAFQALLTICHCKPHEVVFLGDDLPDVPLMKAVGLPIAVANATAYAKKVAAICTTHTGGHGAVREVCDWLLDAKQIATEAP